MPEQRVLDAIESAELIQMADAARPAADPFTLPAVLATLVAARLTDAKTKNAAATMIEGATVGASTQRQQALARLADLLRNGHAFISSVPPEDLPDAQRAQVFADYGWTGGKIGDLTSPARIELLASRAATVSADPGVPAAGKYPASLVTRIANWQATYDAVNLLANGGSRQTLFAGRNAARDLLETVVSRVRHWYCSASDEVEFTPELAKIGMQPKRAPGDAQPQPLPAAPGGVVFEAATRELKIPALPQHATLLRAFRQPAGGPAESAGVSTTATVSVVGVTPLTPGVTYELWVVGENSRGRGPESNHVTFTA